MDYIRQLRTMIGQRPIIAPGASVIIRTRTGEILLVERADNGDWGLPGGLMELGESFEDTARREVAEEVGVDLGDLRLLDVFSGPEFFFRYPNGDEIFSVTAVYLARLPDGADVVVDRAELRSAAFFRPDSLPADLLQPERPVLARYLSGLRATSRRADGLGGRPADTR